MKIETKIGRQQIIQTSLVMLGLMVPFAIIAVLSWMHNPQPWLDIWRRNQVLPFLAAILIARMAGRWMPIVMLVYTVAFLWLDLRDRLPVTDVHIALPWRDWAMIAFALFCLAAFVFRWKRPAAQP